MYVFKLKSKYICRSITVKNGGISAMCSSHKYDIFLICTLLINY